MKKKENGGIEVAVGTGGGALVLDEAVVLDAALGLEILQSWEPPEEADEVGCKATVYPQGSSQRQGKVCPPPPPRAVYLQFCLIRSNSKNKLN